MDHFLSPILRPESSVTCLLCSGPLPGEADLVERHLREQHWVFTNLPLLGGACRLGEDQLGLVAQMVKDLNRDMPKIMTVPKIERNVDMGYSRDLKWEAQPPEEELDYSEEMMKVEVGIKCELESDEDEMKQEWQSTPRRRGKGKKPALTASERQKKYVEKKKAENREAFLQNNKEKVARYLNKMTEEERNIRRIQNREQKKARYHEKKVREQEHDAEQVPFQHHLWMQSQQLSVFKVSPPAPPPPSWPSSSITPLPPPWPGTSSAPDPL